MEHLVKILSIENLTHNVLHIVTEKPIGLTFEPGQAADVSIHKKDWEQELRPFTFTSLPEDEHLEFTIKTYPAHKGVTQQLLSLTKGDKLIVHDVFGEIAYKGEGMFIAGGAGVTPFISIFKKLEAQKEIGGNKLLFANKTKEDIILEDKFNNLLGKNFINILSKDNSEGYEHGYISKELIKNNSDAHTRFYYLCGPEPMMETIEKQLGELGIENKFIVKEGF